MEHTGSDGHSNEHTGGLTDANSGGRAGEHNGNDGHGHEPEAAYERIMRSFASRQLNTVELIIVSLLGFLLAAAAAVSVVVAIFQGVRGNWLIWGTGGASIEMVEHLLYVLMLVEILHTVRISITSHRLVTEPFLIVALIATIRRMLVITLEGSDLTKVDTWSEATKGVFQASLMELGMLGGIVLVLVFAIILMRRVSLHGAEEE